MMTHFQGHPYFMAILFFIFFLFLGAPSMAATRNVIENPLVEFSTSDELMRVAGYGEEKLSTVVISGSVHCDACFNRNSPLHRHPIAGATVAVSCHTSRKASKSNWVRGITDEYGDFVIDLPSHLHAIPNIEKRCFARVVQLPKSSPCHRAFTGKHKAIKLSSVDYGIRIYTSNVIHLTPKYSKPCIDDKRSRGNKLAHTI